MSPNEFQLRAALREGEGARPDADAIIGQAMEARFQRRRRFTAVAAAAAVVAVLGGGTAVLIGSGSSTESGGSNTAAKPNAEHSYTDASGLRGARSSVAGSSAPVAFGSAVKSLPACPRAFPALALPGGGGTGQFGADQPLFAHPVVAMRICLYSSGHNEFAVTPALAGSRAGAIAREMDGSPNSPDSACDSGTAVGEDAAVYAVDSDGRSERVVTVQLGCPYRATNGTAIRFISKQFADSLRPRGPYSSPGHITPNPSHPVGSPIK